MYLNTSHVKVNPEVLNCLEKYYIHLNTSHVKVNLLLNRLWKGDLLI